MRTFLFIILIQIMSSSIASVIVIPFSEKDKKVQDFPFVGKIINTKANGAGSATVIGAGNFLLTSRHLVTEDCSVDGKVLESNNFIFILENVTYDIEKIYADEDADLAILKLKKTCPYFVDKFFNGIEMGEVFYGVGFGRSTTDPYSKNITWDIPYGTKRIYKNRFVFYNDLDTMRYAANNQDTLSFVFHRFGFFDYYSNKFEKNFQPVTGEGIHCFGDSGGGIFIVTKKGICLVGIISSFSKSGSIYKGSIASIKSKKKWIKEITGCEYNDNPDEQQSFLFMYSLPHGGEGIQDLPPFWALPPKRKTKDSLELEE